MTHLTALSVGWNQHSNTANAASGAHSGVCFLRLHLKIFVLCRVPDPRLRKAGLHPGHEQRLGNQQVSPDNRCSEFLSSYRFSIDWIPSDSCKKISSQQRYKDPLYLSFPQKGTKSPTASRTGAASYLTTPKPWIKVLNRRLSSM